MHKSPFVHVFSAEWKEGRKEGRKKGRKEGREEGRKEGRKGWRVGEDTPAGELADAGIIRVG
jgi:predicted transposase YdaD